SRIRIHPTPQPPRRIIQRRLQHQEPVINRPLLLSRRQPCLAGRLTEQTRHIPVETETEILWDPGQGFDPPERHTIRQRPTQVGTVGGAPPQPDQPPCIPQRAVHHPPPPLPHRPTPTTRLDPPPVHLRQDLELHRSEPGPLLLSRNQEPLEIVSRCPLPSHNTNIRPPCDRFRTRRKL